MGFNSSTLLNRVWNKFLDSFIHKLLFNNFCYIRNQRELSICAGTNSLEDCKVKRQVTEEIPHEYYGNFMNDIALLKLENPLIFNESIKPIKIASEEVPANSKVIISGWGRIYTWGPISNKLKFNTLTSLSQSECTKQSGIHFNGIICLGHSLGNGACNVS